MKFIQYDFSLDELSIIENLSQRAVNILQKNSLTSLSKILSYFKNSNFINLKNCGNLTEKELVKLCRKYSNLLLSKSIDKEKYFLETNNDLDFTYMDAYELDSELITFSNSINLLSSENDSMKNSSIIQFKELLNSFTFFQKSVLFKYYKLRLIKDFNKLNSIVNKLFSTVSDEETLNILLADEFIIKDNKGFGNKSLSEIEDYILNLKDVIKIIHQIRNDHIDLPILKDIVEATFKNLTNNLEFQFNQFIDINGKLQLFSLINYLIYNTNILSEIDKAIFLQLYTNHDSINNNLVLIANQYNLSRERIRQRKNIMNNNLRTFLSFVSIMKNSEIVNYLEQDNCLYYKINPELINSINEKEGVIFNVHFYTLIFQQLVSNSCSILQINNTVRKIATKNLQHGEFSFYLIDNHVSKCFNLEKIIFDIHKIIKKKIRLISNVNLKEYIIESSLTIEDEVWNDIKFVFNQILLEEFDLRLNQDDRILNQTNQIPTVNYIYEILEQESIKMSIRQIEIALKEKHPSLKFTYSFLKNFLKNRNDVFIRFGKNEFYGLLNQCDEDENIKIGSIREIVEEYLEQFDEPLHISVITEHVKQFKSKTYERSILDNLKIMENSNFIFFPSYFIGLKSKKYNPRFYKLKKSNCGIFAKKALKKYSGWELNEFVNHYSTLYNSSHYQVKLIILRQIENGKIKLTDGNILEISD
ncbi:MAG: hypothetical protein NT007_07515 [Candidatus Kapabacteria bacterium]|nr:hypothetical protein [Candidatus Kapabacteria bacterium]